MRSSFRVSGVLGWLVATGGLQAYPLDAYEETGIRRLEAFRLSEAGQLNGPPRQPRGALLGREQIRLRL